VLRVIAITPAADADRAAIEALLTINDLPLDGLELALSTAIVARDELDRVVGCVAFEPYGSAALLRSLCVAAAELGTGLGRQLVLEIETRARDSGVHELFLLTETAAEWLARLGYQRVTRDTVPGAMLGSPEFAVACPVDSTVMRKGLADRSP
jgi:amino-acid N-acetyltransferase